MRKKAAAIAIIFFFVFVLAGGSSYMLKATPEVEQPIRFNHKKHTQELGLECNTCHIYYETQNFSGLPTLDICLACHEEKVTDSPEEEKIRTMAKGKRELVWQRLYHVPEHVYYSHRRHVVVGGIECATCHGKIAETTA